MSRLVSCLMITGKCPERMPLAQVAIERFYAQNWAFKELIILNHSQTPIATGKPLITEIMHNRKPHESLGRLRNISVSHAKGDYCLIWDDDDWYHADLISKHMEFCTPQAPTVLRRQLRYSFEEDCALYTDYIHGQKHPCFFKPNAPVYPDRDIGEDTVFLQNFKSVKVIDNPANYYVRLHHGRNILPFDCLLFDIERGVKNISAEDVQLLKEIRARYEREPNFSFDKWVSPIEEYQKSRKAATLNKGLENKPKPSLKHYG